MTASNALQGRWSGRFRNVACALELDFTATLSSSMSSMTGTYSGTNTCTAPVRDGRFSLTKQAASPNEQLSISVEGEGTVTSDPAGISCPGDCEETYASGTTVALTASPASGWVFGGWDGCDTTNGNSCTVTVTAQRSVTATFHQAFTLVFGVHADGGGSVSVDTGGVQIGECATPGVPCELELPAGTEVILTAIPDPGWEILSWSGDCGGQDLLCTFAMISDRVAVARFERVFSLEVAVVGEGTVTSDPMGITCPSDCEQSYTSGTQVTLIPVPASGWQFAGWGGACSGTGICQVSMTENRSVTATFDQAFTLVFGVHADGGGSVSVDTGGIRVGECSSPGAPCDIELPAGTEAVLTATPDPGWQILSWLGDCSGQDPVCTLAMTIDRVAIARFQDASAHCTNYGNAGRTPDYQTYRELMEQVSATGPLYVTSSNAVEICGLVDAGYMLEVMLRQRADVAEVLRGVGALTAVFGRSEGPCDLPYFSDLVGQPPCEARGGLGGVPGRPATACSELNLLSDPDDPFGRGTREDGENVCVHELAHTIMNVGLSSAERDRIRQRFNTDEVHELWEGDFALTNADEFFAEMSQVYYCANPEVPTFNHNHGVNCADELATYDPVTFELIDDIYGGEAADLR